VWHSNSKSSGKSSCDEIIAELPEQGLVIGPNIEIGVRTSFNECTARLIKARVPRSVLRRIAPSKAAHPFASCANLQACCVTSQHAPIFVTCYQSDLLDRKACFEQPTCSFVTEIVKTQIIEIDSIARPVKGGADRF
jgi:hypothetical protein